MHARASARAFGCALAAATPGVCDRLRRQLDRPRSHISVETETFERMTWRVDADPSRATLSPARVTIAPIGGIEVTLC